jgi:hypothetical protein
MKYKLPLTWKKRRWASYSGSPIKASQVENDANVDIIDTLRGDVHDYHTTKNKKSDIYKNETSDYKQNLRYVNNNMVEGWPYDD